MEKKNKLNIPGSKASPRNSQLLVSTGIPALDQLIGGGVPVGTIMLIDEDTYGSYSKVLLRYFLAEGVVSKHVSFIAGLDSNPKDIVCNKINFKLGLLEHCLLSSFFIWLEVDTLPALKNIDSESTKRQRKPIMHPQLEKAFRYEHLPTQEPSIKSLFGNYYDLSKCMSAQDLKKAECHYYTNSDASSNDSAALDNPTYGNLLHKLTSIVKDNRFMLDDKFDVKNIVRVCIHHLGSPMWNSEENFRDLCTFVYYLKCLMRKSFGVAMVSIPSHLSSKLQHIFANRLVHISDIAVRLEGFAGTKHERNKSLSDYNGFFHIIKIAAINSFMSSHPGSVEYTFKLKIRKFCIEKLHLPPDIEEEKDDKRSAPSVACGSSKSHKLDF